MIKPHSDPMVNQHFYESAEEIVVDYNNGQLKETYPILNEAIIRLIFCKDRIQPIIGK